MVDPDTLAGRRREFQQLHDTLMQGAGGQFEAWFEEAEMLKAEIMEETEEIRQCVAYIKAARLRYREILEQIPNVADFSAQELEKKSGKASQLLDLAGEISEMEIHLPRQVEKLRFLLLHPSQ